MNKHEKAPRHDSYESYLARRRVEEAGNSLPVYRRSRSPEKVRRSRIIFFTLVASAALLVSALAFMIRTIQENQAYDRYIETAQMNMLEGDYDSALSLLRKAGSIDFSDDCLLLMAQCYEAQGNYDRAIEALRNMTSTDAAITSKIASIEAKKKIKANAGLVSVAGSSHSITETSLVLDNRSLGDGVLTEIAKMYALSNLSLAGNGITDISPLSALGGLTTLNLSNNAISDLSALSTLTSLRTLYLDGNPITDFSPLYSLPSLTTLSIKGISMTDEALRALSNALPSCAINGAKTTENNQLIALGGETFQADVTSLDLSGRALTDISALSACRNLTSLNLSGNAISDITPLMDIPALQDLTLSYNSIADLRPLMGLTSIRTLDVSYNAVSSTVPLTGLVSLQDLNLAGNPVSNFTGLAGLTNLKSLNLSSTGIDDAASVGLYGLTGLSQLNLENNPAFTGDGYDKLRSYMPGCRILHSDLVYSVPAQSLTISSNTTVLDLANRGVSDLSFLMQLSNLVSANLSRNSISSVNAFQYTDSRWTLTTLDLSYNSITDVTGLSGLQNLTTLDLSNNLITNIMPLYTLRNLRELNVTGNPLSADQIRDLNAILPSCFIRY